VETRKQRLEEQKGRHEGGNKWVGTGGTSPFGHGGYNPEGVRVGGPGKHGRAVKVWEKREYRNLDDQVELGTRNIKVALRRLRRFARQGALDELDMDATIDGTARQGWLDIHMRPERRNTIKVLLFLDIGGSMDAHVKMCEELFSAAKTEFKHLEFFYFHNCLYEGVWKDNRRRHSEKIPTWEVLNKYPGDWRAIFVGDATMSPYEVTMPGGSVEHWNEEAGAVWMKRAAQQWDKVAWLNPSPERYWSYSASVGMIRELVDERMYPLTLEGLGKGMGGRAKLASLGPSAFGRSPRSPPWPPPSFCSRPLRARWCGRPLSRPSPRRRRLQRRSRPFPTGPAPIPTVTSGRNAARWCARPRRAWRPVRPACAPPSPPIWATTCRSVCPG